MGAVSLFTDEEKREQYPYLLMKKKSLSHRTGMRLSSDKGWANYSFQAKNGPLSAFFFF